MYQYIHQRAFSTQSFSSIFQYLRRYLGKFQNPLVNYKINGHTILIPFTHNLPLHRKWHPTYSENLARLATFLHSSLGPLCMIDVGANIGDSYYLVGASPQDLFLLVEGDPTYFSLLERNTQSNPNVTLVHTLVSDEAAIQSGSLITSGGTGKIQTDVSPTSSVLTYTTIDQIVLEYPQFRTTNLLKTDIDGFDIKALLGGIELIKSAKPILFFEHHPQLLADSNTDANLIFAILKQIGYSNAILYDNLGFLFGMVSVDDENRLNDLHFYARYKPGYYYDICIFPDSQQTLAEKFLDEERHFFSNQR